jgi:hypothetical protein
MATTTAASCTPTWMSTCITWNIWFGTSTGSAGLHGDDGQACTCPQELGGNQFVGTVNIPKSGKQAITNLWTQGQNVDAQATLIIRSFSYTHQIRSRT